ncbi:MAG: RNA-binding protein [Oscillospiraceae bacterium]|jgi:RNA-binding protein YlmH|nr:RNA-binding protein [Oscillospiraceae bacterium]
MNQFLPPEDKPLLSRADDLIRLAGKYGDPRFAGFLDERQQAVLKNYFRSLRFENFCFYGGYPEAGRVFAAVWADSPPVPESFPVQAVTFFYRKEENLSHRDFLGAMLGFQLKKESVGDILVSPGRTVAFLTRRAAELVKNEFSKVGRAAVSVEMGCAGELPAARPMLAGEYVVSSRRLDCIVAAVAAKSRGAAAQFIRSSMVSVGFLPCGEISKEVADGDILSLRGYGRYLFRGVISQTKKGRLRVGVDKYI